MERRGLEHGHSQQHPQQGHWSEVLGNQRMWMGTKEMGNVGKVWAQGHGGQWE